MATRGCQVVRHTPTVSRGHQPPMPSPRLLECPYPPRVSQAPAHTARLSVPSPIAPCPLRRLRGQSQGPVTGRNGWTHAHGRSGLRGLQADCDHGASSTPKFSSCRHDDPLPRAGRSRTPGLTRTLHGPRSSSLWCLTGPGDSLSSGGHSCLVPSGGERRRSARSSQAPPEVAHVTCHEFRWSELGRSWRQAGRQGLDPGSYSLS